jgi:dehydrogenase/reductase SDR family member 7B
VLPLDLEDLGSLPQKAAEALKIFGRIDVLIHCAGISQRAFATDTLFETDLKLMKVNYLGPVCLTKATLPSLRHGGHIAVVSSVTGKYGTPYRSGYAASKHALHGFFDSLRAESGNQLKITLICPGFIRTHLSYNALKGDGSKYGVVDPSTATGISPEICAQKIISALKKEKREVVIAGFKERTGLFVKRFFPGLFARLIGKVKVV